MRAVACVLIALSSFASSVVAQNYNVSFGRYFLAAAPSQASGYVLLDYDPSLPAYNYSVFLYNAYGVKNVEMHVAAPGTHGDVVAFLFASGNADAKVATKGLVAKGTLQGHDFVGPLLLPLAQHLDADFLQKTYVESGNVIIVVHTLGNLMGELGAQIPGMAMAPGSGMGMGMSMGSSMHSMHGGMDMHQMSMPATTAPALAPAMAPAMAPAKAPTMAPMEASMGSMAGMQMAGMDMPSMHSAHTTSTPAVATG